MFQPETEDMLPRMAPKPSASIPMGANENTIRPQVPEVSLLFGQQNANAQQQLNSQMHQQQINNNTQQTYAAWKKQMLPKVTYPAAAVTQDTYLTETANNNHVQDFNRPRTNLYPMRPSNTQAPLTMQIGGQSKGFGISSGGVANSISYRRSLESCNENVYQQLHQPYQEQSSRQILPITPTTTSNNTSRDVLTICAGTQTEAISTSPNMAQGLTDIPWSNLASKQDLNDVLQLVQDVRREQIRFAKMIESLIFSRQIATKPETRDMTVQVDLKEKNNPSVVNGCTIVPDLGQEVVVTNKFIQHLKQSANILQTPKGKPMAQSTTYRQNCPQTQRVQDVAIEPTYRQPLNVSPSLTKSSSDTSIAMNELALKYLPNEKLVELLNEFNMDGHQPPRITQNHIPNPSLAVTNNPTPNHGNKENFERAPSDISNASYKYLKKYRLLPEDHEDRHDSNIEENQNNTQYSTPHRQQLYARNSPINNRQTPPSLPSAKCSPYAGCGPLSPLTKAATPSTPKHLVDLENIKHQPKFL